MEMGDDLRQTVRALRSHPGPLLAAILTLALAIGLNAAMLGLVGRAFLDPPEYLSDPDRLVTLAFERGEGDNRVRMTTTSYVTFSAVRDHVSAFSGSAAWQRLPATIVLDGKQLQAHAMLVSGGYFDVLGVRPRVGGPILPEHDGAAAEPVVVLSHAFWRSAFGGDANALGDRGNAGAGARGRPGESGVATPYVTRSADLLALRGPRGRVSQYSALSTAHYFWIMASRLALNSLPGFHSGSRSALATR